MSAISYIIFISVAVLASLLGAVGAYFYYRARHRESVAQLEAFDQDLSEREEELHRLQYQFRNTYPEGSSALQTESRLDVQKLREELEKKNNDYNILKQDFDLEIGIVKQELEQLREENSTVEHSRRHLTRKDAELQERETSLAQKERKIAGRADRLEAEIAARKKDLEDDFSARVRRMEDDFAERDRQLRAREATMEEEREELIRQRNALREKQAQLDEDLFVLPVDRFTSRQEAILIKRLRQQIKLQRDELEQLQRLFHQSSTELKARVEEETGSNANVAKKDSQTGREGGEAHRSPARLDSFEPDHGDPFPAYSALSSYVDRESESTPFAESNGMEPSLTDALPDRYDDLTLLPGIDRGLQRAMHELGITSFDQIARWSSADVRRVSERLGVDRKTIQDRWIINAQSHLFSRNAD